MTLMVCVLTGRSDPGNPALSPVQRAFLDALPIAAHERVDVNFPYGPPTGPWRPTPLPLASARNASGLLASRWPAFGGAHADAVRGVLTPADRTLVLAGSSGLELLANLRLDAADLGRVHVLAYGPVARSRAAAEISTAATLETVVGRRDLLARRWAGRADHVIDAGHLDYLASPEFLAIATRAVERLRAGAHRPDPHRRGRSDATESEVSA